jgi:hypothetical protein
MTHSDHDLSFLHDFYGVLLGIIPSSVTLEVIPEGASIDDTTGDLISAWAATPVSVMHGSNGTPYAAGIGASVRWNTGVVVDKHHVAGRTYLCPLYGDAFDTDGTLNTSDLALIHGAANSLITDHAGELLVWHRPRKAKVGPPVVEARAGSSYAITDGQVPDRCAVLRSRRA